MRFAVKQGPLAAAVRSVLRSSGRISVVVGSSARGGMDLNMHVGCAVRRECPFLVPVPSYNKVNTNNIKIKKKAE